MMCKIMCREITLFITAHQQNSEFPPWVFCFINVMILKQEKNSIVSFVHHQNPFFFQPLI